MEQVWYKPSFIDDPWAALEGRRAGPILRTAQPNAERTEAEAVDGLEAAAGRRAAEATTSASDTSATSDSPLLLPPPLYS